MHSRDLGLPVPGRLARARHAAEFRVQRLDDPGVVPVQPTGGEGRHGGVGLGEDGEEAEGEEDGVVEGEGEGLWRRWRRRAERGSGW